MSSEDGRQLGCALTTLLAMVVISCLVAILAKALNEHIISVEFVAVAFSGSVFCYVWEAGAIVVRKW